MNEYDRDEFQAERAIGERMDIYGLADIGGKKNRLLMTDEEKFKEGIQNYFLAYKDDLKFSDNQLKIISDTIYQIKDVQYKNPLAYILGYYVYDNQKKDYINEKKFNAAVKNIIPKETSVISSPDIIRYARFIHQNNLF